MSKALKNKVKLNDTVNVKDFGAVGDGVTNDTAAFINAMAGGNKTIFMPTGIYLTDFGDPIYQPNMINNIPSGTHFEGVGEGTVWRNFTATSTVSGIVGRASRGCIGTDSGSVSVWTDDLSFRNIKFLGWSQTTASVDEGNSLVFLSSVRRVLIEKCYFVAPRGDAITIASAYGGGPSYERHNYDITIRDCVFDGVNNKNRNAISVIDGDGVVIEGCTFKNFSDTTMPGSIDFEPDEDYSVIKNVTVANNTFSTGTGNRGHVTVSCGSSANLQGVSISNNKFRGNIAIYINTETAVTGGALPAVPNYITISHNIANECTHFIKNAGGSIWGLSIIGNISHALTSNFGRILIGTNVSTATQKDVVISENQFTCNINIGVILYDNWQNCTISNNTFRGSTQYHLRLGGTGAGESSSNIAIHDNVFLGTPSVGIVLHQFDTKNPTTNVWRNNYAPVGVTHGFSATMTDFTGSTINVYGTEALPNSFPYGVHKSIITSASVIGSGTDFGMLTTYAESSYGTTYTWQEYKPAISADKAKTMHRTAASSTTWSAWYTVTGV